MKFTPQACCLILTWPWPGAGTSICSKVRTSGPPVLCTRTAATMFHSMNYVSGIIGSAAIIGSAPPSASSPLKRHYLMGRRPSAAAGDAQVRAGDVGRRVRQKIEDCVGDLLRRAGPPGRDHRRELLDAAWR